jgi:hypothetical protein
MNKLILALVTATLLIVSSAYAGTLEEANKAYATGNYAEATKQYELAAEQGDAKAQFMLGNMHALGQGVVQDYAKAFYWHKLAAEQGDAKAQYLVGYMFYKGQGVVQDYAKAFK